MTKHEVYEIARLIARVKELFNGPARGNALSRDVVRAMIPDFEFQQPVKFDKEYGVKHVLRWLVREKFLRSRAATKCELIGTHPKPRLYERNI